jgi:mannose-6-phosphate isomerase-like protein (cupin superfamily)
VSDMNEGPPHAIGSLRICHQVGRNTGAQAISLRILEFGPGVSPGLRNQESDEVLYLLEGLDGATDTGVCRLFIDGRAHEITAQTGVYLQPGQTLTVDNPGPTPIKFVSSLCPDLSAEDVVVPAMTEAAPGIAATKPAIVRLSDRKAVPTADRWYRVLVDDEVGSQQVTQFVGSIPPGRAPDHYHQYEEVLFILRGLGRMWAGETNTPIAPGSCIYLPTGQMHCVENTGDDELRLLGVFYPAGSPAVRYET